MFSSRNSQRGFSLVELMVVVAIIGVLATIAIPSIGKYIAKARQTEAKTGLSSLYTSEKAFYAEYNAYHSSFQAIGYSPEGRLRYNVGFGAVGTVAGVANGYNPPAGLSAAMSTVEVCQAGGANIGANQFCSILNGADNLAPPVLGAANTVNSTTSTFQGGAVAVIHNSGLVDTWQIDQSKQLNNTISGIP